MSTYESTISLMKGLNESDLLKIKEFVVQLISKPGEDRKTCNPYKPLTREEIIEQLEKARTHAEEGRVMDAFAASEDVRAKYGL